MVFRLRQSKKFTDIFQPVSDEEYSLLEQDLLYNGQKVPIDCDETGVILDGNRVYEILTKHGIVVNYNIVKSVKNDDDRLYHFLQKNFLRRHLNDMQKIEIALKYFLPLQERLAKDRQLQGTLIQCETKGRAMDFVAGRCGVSASTLFKGKAILDSGNNEIINKTLSGQITINNGYNRTISEQMGIRKMGALDLELPKDVHNIFYIDPSWAYDNEATGGSHSSGSNQQYPTMTPKEVCDMGEKVKPIIAKDAVMFMWVTNPLLPEQLKVFESWGFEYKTLLTWIKMGRKGIGYWFSGETEHLAFGVRGNITAFRSGIKNYVTHQVLRHSEKPDEFRKLIEVATEKMPVQKRIEMWARKHVDGWTYYGNELLQQYTLKQK